MPVAREGWPFIAVPGVVACILGLVGWWPGAVVAGLVAVACLGFFRDPERSVPQIPGAVLAPADGRVMTIAEVNDPFVGPAVRVSIFLSPLDVHVNRAPVAAVVRSVESVGGRFLPAYRVEASEVNERCTLGLEGDRGRVTVRQIAGVLARRIVCRVRPGDKLEAGERFGLIRFGSRTDLVLPRGSAVSVRTGDRVRGGETVMGMLP
ncbi:MAG: phosphatidylserine decarboxylase family protein [Candidatus Rokubacteria bacterium]|nr:phosphatidylserine decarboxylase family protein [Candidatus Rokubacteria bacterium]